MLVSTVPTMIMFEDVTKPTPAFVHARYLDLNQSLTTAGAFIAASTHRMLRNSRAQIEGSTAQVHSTGPHNKTLWRSRTASRLGARLTQPVQLSRITTATPPS